MFSTDPLSAIGFGSLDFDRVPVLCQSSAGSPYTRMVAVGMPRIPPKPVDLVFYLYETRADAEAGRVSGGGSGFFVGYPSERFPKYVHHTYAVTNWHVACRGSSVLRVNTLLGVPDIYEYDPSEWVFDPRYDIAVKPFNYRPGFHKIGFVPVSGFVNEKDIDDGYACVGEDVFMIGRFIDYDGGQTNKPAVRFGHISTAPVPIKQENGKYAESYCIDLHSRSGFSGSPVFAYRTPGGNLEDPHPTDNPKDFQILRAGTNFLALLGVHWGQFPELWELTNSQRLAENARSHVLITEGAYVKGMSGMTCVLPASAILEVLNSDELKAHRAYVDQGAYNHFLKVGFPPEGELPHCFLS